MTQAPQSRVDGDLESHRPDDQDTEMTDLDGTRGLLDNRKARVHPYAQAAANAATAVGERFGNAFWTMRPKPETKPSYPSCAPQPPPHQTLPQSEIAHLPMPEPVHTPIHELAAEAELAAEISVTQQDQVDVFIAREAELKGRIEQLETYLASAPSVDSVRALERALQEESTRRERAEQDVRQKNNDVDVLRKRWKQAARELDKARSQHKGFHQVTDNYLIELTSRLRYNIRNFAIQYFGGELKGNGPSFEKTKAWDAYMASTTPGSLNFELLLISERRQSVIQAFLWRFIAGQVFDNFRWAGENGITLRNLCLSLRPEGQYPDSTDPIVPEEERKFQVWLASTTAMVLDVGNAPSTSKTLAAQVDEKIRSLVDKIREVIDHFATVTNPGYTLELTRIVEEAVQFDTEISRQVARVEWVFPALGKAVLFDAELMRLGTGEPASKEREQQLVRLVVCPAMKKRGKSTGDEFGSPPTLLVPMEVSCEPLYPYFLTPFAAAPPEMRPKSRNDFAIAIICALPLEADAVEALFDEHYDRLGKYYGKTRGDANAYINGRMGKHDVVLCYMPGMGKGSAAAVAASLNVSYASIELALVVGICGGAPWSPESQEIFLGDVIISDSVIEYDFGRQYPGGFLRKPGVKDTLGRPSREIRSLLNGLRARNARIELQSQTQQYLRVLQQSGPTWSQPGVSDLLFRASYLHKHYSHSSPARCSCLGSNSQICDEAMGQDCDRLHCDSGQQIRCREISEALRTSIYIGSVASGDTVMKSGQHRDEIAKREKVIGFDMEGAGVWDNVPCIIIKGVCDYADSHKSKLWQPYAAATGASVAKAFLEYWMPVSREASHCVFRNIPFSRNQGFIGRGEQLDKLEALLFSPGCQRKVAITGLGGVGKTQVALEFAYRIQHTRPECSIYWIPATNLEILQQTYLQIAKRLALPGVDEEQADAGKLLKDYLCDSKAGQWLLIFDNADDMSMWFGETHASPEPCGQSNHVPWSTTGSVLFTSRFKRVASKLAKQNVIEIPEMDETRATELLFERLTDKSILDQTKEVVLLLKELVYLPLAIVQAASYINENCLDSLSDYLSLLSGQEHGVIDLLSEDFEDEWRADRKTNPVAATWLISFEQIQRTQPFAADILCFMATIEPADIPQSILPPAPTHKAWIEAIGTLKGYAFVSRRAAEQSFDLHRLIHLATRNWLRQKAILSKWTVTALTRLEAIFPNNDHTNRHVWQGYLPHALRLLEREETQSTEVKGEDTRYDLIAKVAMCLRADGRAMEAVKCLEEHYNWRKTRFDEEHPYRLASQHALAGAYQANGQIPQAVELLDHV
ncbi:hypothetical protein BJX76DRAFT_360039, partial [Aspergillus varians]